ncbi:MAG: PIN domain nuclease [Rhodospirillaceae bacterium]|nr:PIN domain nuclease [Rhodospirillaceae bacterium]
MIVVDSSVWIDHFAGTSTSHARLLVRLMTARDRIFAAIRNHLDLQLVDPTTFDPEMD